MGGPLELRFLAFHVTAYISIPNIEVTNMPESESLEELLGRLREDRTLFMGTEEATRQGAVLPILARLGWDRDNIRQVIPEYSVGDGRVDYCLKVAGQGKEQGKEQTVFIEVKRTSEDLDRHQRQLLAYAFDAGVKIAVLTNGLVWWFYLALADSSWEQRKFFTIDIEHRDPQTAAKYFRDFLERDAIAHGSPVERAERVRADKKVEGVLRKTIPVAWKELCEEPDELLLELFTEKVENLCGHRPDPDMLAEYLATVNMAPAGDKPAHPEGPTITRRPRGHRRRDSYKFKAAVAYSFRGQRHPVRSWKEVLVGLCSDLYEVHGVDFERVLGLRGRKLAYFSRDPEGMIKPREIPGPGIHAETNFSADDIMDRCYEVLDLFGHSEDEFQVEARVRRP